MLGCTNMAKTARFTKHRVICITRCPNPVMLPPVVLGMVAACCMDLAEVKPLSGVTAELFDVLSMAASAKKPGEALLRAGQAARWPILALLAACYDDVSTLSCMAAWLRCSLHRSTSGAAGPCTKHRPLAS